jgi:hypothetical protein
VGLQVGWPILAAALLALALVAQVRRRGVRRGLQARLLLALGLAFFVVWSPVDFWRHVPSLFYNIQITYRALMFVVLWGSVLAGVALAAAFRGRGGMRPAAGLAVVFAVGLAAMPNTVWGRSRLLKWQLAGLQTSPDFGPGLGMYLPLTDRIRQWQAEVPPGVKVLSAADTRPHVRQAKATRYRAELVERTVVQLPVLFYPGMNEVTDFGRPLRIAGHLDGLLALDLPPGDHHIRVEFAGLRWANVVSGAAWLGVALPLVVALVRRAAKRRRGSPERPAPRAVAPPAPALFPAHAAVVCFALLAAPMSLPEGISRWNRSATRRTVGKLTVSSEGGRELEGLNAFDRDPATTWAAVGSDRASLTLEPPRPRLVSRVRLEARRTDLADGSGTLLETWQTVRVLLYRGGRQVAEQWFWLPGAAAQAAQEVTLDAPAEADRIELRFYDPVSATVEGRKIDARSCNPGYAEIHID